MGRHDVATFLQWATGTSLVATVPRVVELPPVLAAVVPWVTGIGILIAAVMGILIGLTKGLTELTAGAMRLVEARTMLEEAGAKFRRTRRVRKTRGRQRRKRAQLGTGPPSSSLAAKRRPDAPKQPTKAA
jgi:hypothetical protein